jgi:hypothetical protein
MQDSAQVQLHTLNRTIVLDPNCFLVGIDETGHEEFADEMHPIFGLGGCGVLAKDYERLIKGPWDRLKAEHFGGADARLHANELSSPSSDQLLSLGNFFRNNPFSRIAVLCSDHTAFADKLYPYQITARWLLEQIGNVAARYPITGVVLIIEESSRTDRLAYTYLNGYEFRRRGSDGNAQILPFEKFRMPKSRVESLLEVSDFIIQAAGGQVRARLAGRPPADRRDFQAIFREVDEKFVGFLEITEAKVG